MRNILCGVSPVNAPLLSSANQVLHYYRSGETSESYTVVGGNGILCDTDTEYNVFEIRYIELEEQQPETAPEPPPTCCSLCPKTFSEAFKLKRHVALVHNSARPYICDVCSKAFTERYRLKAHLATHSDIADNPFPCPVCRKIFRTRQYCQQHMKSHVKADLPCSFCDKWFRHRASLAAHKRRWHSGEKVYGCPSCSTRFAVRSDLTRHLHTHNSDTCYVCASCGKAFLQKRYLVAHLHSRVPCRPIALTS